MLPMMRLTKFLVSAVALLTASPALGGKPACVRYQQVVPLGSLPGDSRPVHASHSETCVTQTGTCEGACSLFGSSCDTPYGCAPGDGFWGCVDDVADGWRRLWCFGDEDNCNGDSCCDVAARRLHRRWYFKMQDHCRHFLYPVCPPYCAPNYGHYPTCWRPFPPSCHPCPPAGAFLAPQPMHPAHGLQYGGGYIAPAPQAPAPALPPAAAPPAPGDAPMDEEFEKPYPSIR